MAILPKGLRVRKARWGGLPFSLVVLVMLVLASFIVNPLLNLEPNVTNIAKQYAEPSKQYLFGTDSSGRDIFARVVAAAKLDLGIAAGASAASFVMGTLLGAVAGYVGGRLERGLLYLFDMWQAIPGMLLGLLVLAVT